VLFSAIGIFTGKFEAPALLARLGLRWHTFKRGSASDRESYFRPYTDDERARIKAQIGYYYGRFIGAVARGRSLSEKRVDQVGRGRVWTGRQAKAVKLVDDFGGIGDALALAKERAGIDRDVPVQVLSLPQQTGNLLQKLLGFGASAQGDGLDAVRALGFGAVGALVNALPASLWVQPSEPQARLPFSIIWE